MEHRGKKDRHCTICSFKCDFKSRLELHMRKHTKEKPFLCDVCKREFMTNKGLQLHIFCVHREFQKTYKCSSCNYVTLQKPYLKIHQLKHTDERSFPCPHPNCTYAAKSPTSLRMHNTYKHKSERNFFCAFKDCGYRAKTTQEIKRHCLKHSDFKPFVCDFAGCSYRGKTMSAVKIHKRGVHSMGHKPFACSRCTHRTTSTNLLKSHQLTHTEEKPVNCIFSGCSFSCKEKRHLKNHVLRRHAERTFSCDFVGCSSTAASRSKLEEHKKLVHYEKVHKCQHCDFRAARASLLQRHIQVHYRSRRLPCPHTGCTFKTRQPGSLSKHMKNHKANLACPVEGCGHVCNSISSRECHMQRHNPTDRPFHCPLCPQHFTIKFSLESHLRRHTAEKSFKCPLCNYQSPSKCMINQHVRKVHSVVFSKFESQQNSTCDHCNMDFGSRAGLAIHSIKVKTAAVILTRLQLKE